MHCAEDTYILNKKEWIFIIFWKSKFNYECRPFVLINGKKQDGRAIKNHGVCTYCKTFWEQHSSLSTQRWERRIRERKQKLGYKDEKRRKGEII